MSVIDWIICTFFAVGLVGFFLTRFLALWPYLLFIGGSLMGFVNYLMEQQYGWAALWTVFLAAHAWNYVQADRRRRESRS